MKPKVMEIFKSFQGEGKYVGVPQVFVRFFECNMHCVWCDTPNSIGDTTRKYNEMDIEDLKKEIQLLYGECHSVSLTGGEPLLQKDAIKELLPFFKKNRITSYLETNGTLPDALREIIDETDIVAMDIKLPSSTEAGEFWAEHEEFLKIGRKKDLFIKTVISSNTDQKDLVKAVDLVASIDPEILFILQPNYFEMKNGAMTKCLAFQELSARKLKDVRILPQVHKFMKLR